MSAPAALAAQEVRIAWTRNGQGHRCHWWRYTNGWTKCSPEHHHRTPEAAVRCHDKETKST